jgi:hypothetical protein
MPIRHRLAALPGAQGAPAYQARGGQKINKKDGAAMDGILWQVRAAGRKAGASAAGGDIGTRTPLVPDRLGR